MSTFRIEQKITPLANQYRVYQGADSPDIIAFVHQKRFAFREKFELYGDEAKTQLIATIQARQAIDLGARYDVTGADGHKLGVLNKNFKQSLLRSTWEIRTPDEPAAPLATVRERSLPVAILRRLWEFIPVVGGIPFFIKFHFEFITASGSVSGSYVKTTLLRDHYLLEVAEPLASAADWRVYVSLGIMLDAMQSR